MLYKSGVDLSLLIPHAIQVRQKIIKDVKKSFSDLDVVAGSITAVLSF